MLRDILLRCKCRHKRLDPERFLLSPSWEYEFRRKVSDSEWAWKSYCSTWRRLGRYTRSRTWQLAATTLTGTG